MIGNMNFLVSCSQSTAIRKRFPLFSFSPCSKRNPEVVSDCFVEEEFDSEANCCYAKGNFRNETYCIKTNFPKTTMNYTLKEGEWTTEFSCFTSIFKLSLFCLFFLIVLIL